MVFITTWSNGFQTQCHELPEFHPSSTTVGFKKWKDGAAVNGQLFGRQILKSFQQRIQELNLPTEDHYTFLQVRNYLQEKKKG